MMIFNKAIPRRMFLRGLGATVALPLLDAMVPAFARTIDAAKPVTRLSAVYFPTGFIMNQWTPAAAGAGFKLTPIMQPLAPFRDRHQRKELSVKALLWRRRSSRSDSEASRAQLSARRGAVNSRDASDSRAVPRSRSRR